MRFREARGHRRAFDGRGIDTRRVDGVPGALAVRRLGGVAPAGERAQIGQGALGARIADDDHAPALAIAAARREACLIEDLRQHLVGQGIGRELPGGEGRSKYVVQFHQ